MTETRSLTDQTVTVMVLSPHDEDHASLNEILRHSNWQIHNCWSRREAREILDSYRVSVILCDRDLKDGGNWKEFLDETSILEEAPLLVVTSRYDDDVFWADVLNLGGYDVLAKPFEANEVIRITSLAWLHWRDRAKPSPQLSVLRAAC